MLRDRWVWLNIPSAIRVSKQCNTDRESKLQSSAHRLSHSLSTVLAIDHEVVLSSTVLTVNQYPLVLLSIVTAHSPPSLLTIANYFNDFLLSLLNIIRYHQP